MYLLIIIIAPLLIENTSNSLIYILFEILEKAINYYAELVANNVLKNVKIINKNEYHKE